MLEANQQKNRISILISELKRCFPKGWFFFGIDEQSNIHSQLNGLDYTKKKIFSEISKLAMTKMGTRREYEVSRKTKTAIQNKKTGR